MSWFFLSSLRVSGNCEELSGGQSLCRGIEEMSQLPVPLEVDGPVSQPIGFEDAAKGRDDVLPTGSFNLLDSALFGKPRCLNAYGDAEKRGSATW